MIKKDEELDAFEENLRKLKNKYDQFFTGITKTPPSQDRRNIEVFIHEFSKRKMRDGTRRFRFSTMVSRYNQYREMWARKMREREEGPLDFRRRQAALNAPVERPPEPAPLPVTSPKPDPYVKVAPGTNGDEIRRLYLDIERAHVELGKLPTVTYEQVADMVSKQSELVRARYHVNTVAFRVETVDGKVKLKAKPLQD